MNNEVIRISQIKLSYNEVKKCIVAKVVTVFENGLKQEKTLSKMDLISDMLNSFAKQEDLTILELIEKGLVIIDEVKLKDKEVLIKDNDTYKKLIYNSEKKEFEERRLSRIERRELGLININEDIEDEIVRETPKEEDNLTDLMDIALVVDEIRKLNPDVEIALGDKESDPRYSTRFFASVSANELKLPKGFYYNDKNGITNKHHTRTGIYVYFDVEPLIKVDEASSSFTGETKEEELVKSDGALDVTESSVENTEEVHETKTKEKDKKGIKFLKYAARALAIVAAGYVIVKSGIFSFKNDSKNNDRSDDNNDHRYEDNIEDSHLETTYTNEEVEVITPEVINEVYEANKEDDIEIQIQRVNDACFSYEPCSLYTLVSSSDRQSIEAITMLRNEVLANNYDIIDLLDQYVKYIFEGGTMFDGHVVKAYDYLSPYARYIVLVSAQSMLQLYPEYNYSTIYNGNTNIYYYDNLTDSFNDYVDQVYRELTNKSKTY